MARIAFILLLILTVLSGCGQKGPLFLPQAAREPQTPAPPPPPLPQQDADSSDEDEVQLQEDEPADIDAIPAAP